MADLHGVHANAVVLDERHLTQRVSGRDVRQTYENFQKRVDANDDGLHAELILSTTEVTEARASSLLDFGEAALARLFGADARTDISVVTAQRSNAARVRVTGEGLTRVTDIIGASHSSISKAEFENFLAQRASTEYQLMLLKFFDTDLIPDVDITLELLSTGRTLTVGRARRFR